MNSSKDDVIQGIDLMYCFDAHLDLQVVKGYLTKMPGEGLMTNVSVLTTVFFFLLQLLIYCIRNK